MTQRRSIEDEGSDYSVETLWRIEAECRGNKTERNTRLTAIYNGLRGPSEK